MGCSWHDLPSDLVGSLAERLCDVDDFLRLGAVCRPWSEAVTGFRPVPTSPRFPWLVSTSKLTSKEVLMYSPNNHRVNRLPVPTPLLGVGSRVVGCHCGWLATVDDSLDFHVFNPVTGDRGTNLPSSTLMNKHNIASGIRVNKVALSSIPRPSADSIIDHVVAAAIVYCFNDADAIAFAKSGDDAWSGSIGLPFPVKDVIYCRGNFFVFDSEGRYRIFDPSTGPEPRLAVASRIPLMLPYDYNLVLCPSCGHLLVVGRVAAQSQSTTKRLVVVLKYNPDDADSPSSRWVEINDLGDKALFVGGGHAMFLPVGNSSSSSIRRNCIYFTNGSESDAVVPMFDIEKGVIEPSPILHEQQSLIPYWNESSC